MRRRRDNWKQREAPDSSYDDDREEFAQSPLRRMWFPALLGGVGVLGLAFILLPYLVDWIDSTSTARRPLVATPLVPPETPISLTSPPLTPPPAPQKPEVEISSRPESPLPSPAGKREPVSTIPPAKATVETAKPAVEKPPSRPAARPVLPKEQFWVQVGAFKDGKHAARFAAKLAAQYPVVVRHGESASAPHVVQVGRYPSRERAEEVRDTLKTKGFRGFILRDDSR